MSATQLKRLLLKGFLLRVSAPNDWKKIDIWFTSNQDVCAIQQGFSGSHWYKCMDVRNLGISSSLPMLSLHKMSDVMLQIPLPLLPTNIQSTLKKVSKVTTINVAFRKLSAAQHVVSWPPFEPWSRLICGAENHQNFQPWIFTCYLSTEKKPCYFPLYWYTGIFVVLVNSL